MKTHRLSDSDLQAFWARCLRAARHGFVVANAEQYARALEEEADVPTNGELTAAQLATLARDAIDARRSPPKFRIVTSPEVPAPAPETDMKPARDIRAPEPSAAAEPEVSPAMEPQPVPEPTTAARPEPSAMPAAPKAHDNVRPRSRNSGRSRR